MKVEIKFFPNENSFPNVFEIIQTNVESHDEFGMGRHVNVLLDECYIEITDRLKNDPEYRRSLYSKVE